MTRIVVVEDDPMSQRLMRDVLEVQGYEVMLFGRAEEGIAYLNANTARLVLMDIRLPGIDGFEALKQLRALPQTVKIPVIAVTASVMLNEQARIEAAGFDAYHPKPIQIPTLLKQIHSFIT